MERRSPTREWGTVLVAWVSGGTGLAVAILPGVVHGLIGGEERVAGRFAVALLPIALGLVAFVLAGRLRRSGFGSGWMIVAPTAMGMIALWLGCLYLVLAAVGGLPFA